MGGSDRRWQGLASFGGGGLWGLGYPGRSRMYSCSVSAAKPIAGYFLFFFNEQNGFVSVRSAVGVPKRAITPLDGSIAKRYDCAHYR